MHFAMSTILTASCLLAAESTSKPIPPTPKIDDPRSVTVGTQAVVPIFVCQFQNTLLILPEAELIRKSFIADTVNWKLESARDDQASRYVSIKVKEPLSKETTLNVISDRDSSYTFRLILNTEHCDSKVSIEADSQLEAHIQATKPWAPPEKVEQLQHEIEQAQAGVKAAESKADSAIASFRSQYPAKLRFDYKFDPKLAEKMGIHQIFHDGTFTYVAGTPEETPTLYEVKQGKPNLISFEFRDGLYSTGRVISDGYLAVGGNGNGKHQEKLEFHRAAEVN